MYYNHVRIDRVLVSREMKWKPHHKFTSHAHKRLTAQVFSVFSIVLWLTTSLGSVGEGRLMLFSVYFLMWQLLSCVVLAGHLAAF